MQVAKGIQMTTRFSDDDATAAESQLANYIKEESVIKQLMPLVADLATAKHIGLSEAANKVAIALAKDNKEFGKFGIHLQGAAGSTERLTSLTKGLSAAFGGQASAMANSPLGRIAQMKNEINNIQEDIEDPRIDDISIIGGDRFTHQSLVELRNRKTRLRGTENEISTLTQKWW
jgi:hypothetical protein